MKRGIAIVLFLWLPGLGNGFFQAAQPDLETAWVCPMHADYTMDVAGLCPCVGHPQLLVQVVVHPDQLLLARQIAHLLHERGHQFLVPITATQQV